MVAFRLRPSHAHQPACSQDSGNGIVRPAVGMDGQAAFAVFMRASAWTTPHAPGRWAHPPQEEPAGYEYPARRMYGKRWESRVMVACSALVAAMRERIGRIKNCHGSPRSQSIQGIKVDAIPGLLRPQEGVGPAAGRQSTGRRPNWCIEDGHDQNTAVYITGRIAIRSMPSTTGSERVPGW